MKFTKQAFREFGCGFRCGVLSFIVILVIYINIEIGKNRLASDHLHGKLLFTWLSLVMSLMVSFCAVPFPMRCLG